MLWIFWCIMFMIMGLSLVGSLLWLMLLLLIFW